MCALRALDSEDVAQKKKSGLHGTLALMSGVTCPGSSLSRSFTQAFAFAGPRDPQTWLWDKPTHKSILFSDHAHDKFFPKSTLKFGLPWWLRW